MGANMQPPFVSFDAIGYNARCNNGSGCLWSKVLEARAKRSKWQLESRKQRVGDQTTRKIGGRMVLMMKRRRANVTGNSMMIRRKVRALKKLIPNSESMGLDGLFRETADYILNLQMKLELMQIMVNVLSASDD